MPLIKKLITKLRPKGILWEFFQRQLVGALAAGLIIFFCIYLIWPGDMDLEIATAIVLGSPVVVFLSSWVSWYKYLRNLKQSINYMGRYILELKRGNLNNRLDIHRDDEIQDLGERLEELTKDYKQQVRASQKKINENKDLIARAEEAASLEERRKLARELHDAVSQQLFAASMSMKAMDKMIYQDPDKARQLFSKTTSMIQNAQQELRALILHLRPVTLEGKSLSEGLEQLLQEIKDKHKNFNISWEITQLPELASGVEDQVFRVIQEAISNMLRHSQAKNFIVNGKYKGNRIYISLEDDGVGFNLSQALNKQSSSYGLKTMKERMVELGGHLNILTYPGSGTRVELRLPITSSEKESGENDSNGRESHV
ncbi:sensor histidine kinase [Natranaerobius thermophilus]|uniref:histidine kinase n=1 Tax=Natranaerobius thermophilus (strain ATCC BAA-1301 / DSM 18059 / JW/NM-WN-LF) TaxID=457570 RepID=B2A756_NATTJ|nr:sensor histidine kinase [Natranaerobius thermophilus]ACB85647.1 integral membrane sensor signal transduction histidine kinase [Natranaerobius thermophilus JW/NM-WN-LF]